MTLIRNVSPRGALDVPLLGRLIDAGEATEVTDAQAAILLAQVDVWHPADAAPKAPVRKTATADTTEGDAR